MELDIYMFEDPYLLNEREYLSYGDILTDPRHKHLRVPNLYQTKKVCENCFDALSKIDKYRKIKTTNK